MKAYHLTAPGLDHLTRVTLDPPRPGPGEVLLRLHAASLNYLDLMVVGGEFPVRHWPLIPVCDGAGEVVECGPGVEDLAVGSRVVPSFASAWLDGRVPPLGTRQYRGLERPGSLADYVAVPAAAVVRLPDRLSYAAAATLPIAATTAWTGLRQAAIGPHSTVLLLGTGGVAMFGLQFAKGFGARVIVTSSSDEKLARARELGADETINYRATPEWDSRVLHLTEGRGADFVMETTGAATMQRSLNAAALEAMVYVVGMVTGADLTASVYPILMKRLRIQGSNTGSVADLRELVGAVAQLRLEPVIDEVFPFEATRQAYDKLAAARHFGKLVVTI